MYFDTRLCCALAIRSVRRASREEAVQRHWTEGAGGRKVREGRRKAHMTDHVEVLEGADGPRPRRKRVPESISCGIHVTAIPAPRMHPKRSVRQHFPHGNNPRTAAGGSCESVAISVSVANHVAIQRADGRKARAAMGGNGGSKEGHAQPIPGNTGFLHLALTTVTLDLQRLMMVYD